jgi:methylated-DNA-protein-cysteine methyltransferase-like protein
MSDFFKDVVEVVELIPQGKITTYGMIANYLGAKKSSRVVGWALNKVSKNSEIPAHRVVNRNGLLTGKNNFPTKNYMKDELQKEGLNVKEDSIEDFTKYLWDPIKELTI